MYIAAEAFDTRYNRDYVSYSCDPSDGFSDDFFFGTMTFTSEQDLSSQHDIEQDLRVKFAKIESDNLTIDFTVLRLQIVTVTVNMRVIDPISKFNGDTPLIDQYGDLGPITESNDPSYLSYTFNYIPSGYKAIDNVVPNRQGVTSSLVATFHGPSAQHELIVIATAGDMSSSKFYGSECLTPPLDPRCERIGMSYSGEDIYSIALDGYTTTYTTKQNTHYILFSDKKGNKTDEPSFSDQEIVQVLSNVMPR